MFIILYLTKKNERELINKFKIYALSHIFFILTFSCQTKNKEVGCKWCVKSYSLHKFNKTGKPKIERNLIKQGLVNIQDIDTTLKIDLRYSTTNNFVEIDLYGELTKVYAQKEVAVKLKKAQAYLKEKDSSLSLLIFDAVRPHHIQKLMWDTLKIPLHEKTKFLSNPINHSVHNYGAAVDLSIVDINGKEFDMGTPYDYIGKLGFPRLEKHFLETGELTPKQVDNRLLLRSVMVRAGFRQLQTEWWHYNSCSRTVAKEKYSLIE